MSVQSQSRWNLRVALLDTAEAVREALGCPAVIAHILANRCVNSFTAPEFLVPTLSALHDPMLLCGMQQAVSRIQKAVLTGEKILIYGDYDVDGTTATVLLKTAIERIAPPDYPALVSFHVPHRLREGYGIQNVRLGEAALSGVSLVISVDTGIRAFAAADEAKALGLDLIVTDHHLPDGVAGIPEAVAVINPAQAGCRYPNKDLCGAGVAFKLAHALLAAHATTDVQYRRLNNVLLPSFLKLVAIATVADSVALTGENRAIVWLGLRALANPIQPGLRALMQVAKIALDQPPTATEVGFRLAPRINAAGRMDVASDVVDLFLTRDPVQAWLLAEKLDQLNQDRRASEAVALEAIELQLLTLRESTGQFPAECLVLDHPEWHRGVLGILASRVVERTNRPALVLTHDGEDAHGSGRSVAGFHLLNALTAADNTGPPIFSRFGGHAHAVGFSLPSAKVPALRAALRAYTSTHLTPELLASEIFIDAEVEVEALNEDLLIWLDRLAPYGHGHPEPVLLCRGLTLTGQPRIIKGTHVCVPLQSGLSAMGWTRPGHISWAERVLPLNLLPGARVDCVFRLGKNKHPQFGGLELGLIDLVPTDSSEVTLTVQPRKIATKP